MNAGGSSASNGLAVAIYIAVAFIAPCILYCIWHTLRAYILEEWSVIGLWRHIVGKAANLAQRLKEMFLSHVQHLQPEGLRSMFVKLQLYLGRRTSSSSDAGSDSSGQVDVEPRVVLVKMHSSPAAVHPISPVTPASLVLSSSSDFCNSSSSLRGKSSVYLPGSMIVVPPEKSGSALFAPGPRPLPVLVEA